MRRVTLSQIEAFCCIVRYGSFRAAASHLNLTQPTLSIRIRSMEDVLGFRLFKKVGRGTQPTMDAEGILPQAERLLVMADDFAARPKPTDALRGSLRLGAPECFGTICLPDLLGPAACHHDRPGAGALQGDQCARARYRLHHRAQDGRPRSPRAAGRLTP